MESLFYKAAGLTACSVIKRRLQNRCFPVNIVKFLKTAIYRNLYCLLLNMWQSKVVEMNLRSQIRGNRHTRDVQKQFKNKFSIINTSRRLATFQLKRNTATRFHGILNGPCKIHVFVYEVFDCIYNTVTKQICTCSKSTIEIIKKGCNMSKCNNNDTVLMSLLLT